MYTDKVMDHFSNPRNIGEIENADGVGEVGNPVCGDMMSFYINIEDNKIADIKFVAAEGDDRAAGLLAWISCVIDDTVLIDGITLRRTLDGRLALSFPSRRDSSGRQHPIVRPLDDRARREIETQIFAALGLGEAHR